ncbi:MAG: hypothetical protein M1821_008981 [Bathelium mastoideum]|nr:MAG: hypothetical protein M1821_008981 [Bathelium mastoideum]
MTAGARSALWLVKPVVVPVASAPKYTLSTLSSGSLARGWRTWDRNAWEYQRAASSGKAGPGTYLLRLRDSGCSKIQDGKSTVRTRLNGMCWGCQRRYLESERKKDNENKKSRPKLVESTRKLREQVQSRLANLTPHENIYTVPNALTFSRLLAAPAIGYLVLHDYHAWAVGLFAYAGITDLIDGYIARHWNLQTVVGSVIDPMADKTLMFILTVCLAAKAAIPLYLATLILGRDASLAVAAIYYRYASLPAPKTFSRYWDFSLPSAEVHPTTVSKYNTFLQLILLGATTALPLVSSDAHHLQLGGLVPLLEGADIGTAMTAFQILVAATTAWSGMSYAFLKDAVKILGRDEELKRKQGRRGRAVIGVSFASCFALAAWFAVKKPEEQIKESRQKGA